MCEVKRKVIAMIKIIETIIEGKVFLVYNYY
jgi:hypothetical protein